MQETATNFWQTQFTYDGFGRRRSRQDYVWQMNQNQWTLTNTVYYIYDGMTVLQERDGNNNPLVSYTRGTDLSGTPQGAGGIGGLLARTDTNGSSFYHTDGNGNVTMLVSGTGTVLAKYLYDSYGNTVGSWGTLANANTYRFSSKEMDLKSGLYYYGYRYYQPNLQRWLNHDPIQEEGGINLYGFVGNSPVNWVDSLGLEIYFVPSGFNGPPQPGDQYLYDDPYPYTPTPAETMNDGGLQDLSQDFYDVATLTIGGFAMNALDNAAVKKCAARAAARAAAEKAESDLIAHRADLQNLIKTLQQELDAMKNEVTLVKNEGDPVPPQLFKQIEDNQNLLSETQQQLMEATQKLKDMGYPGDWWNGL